MILGDIESVDNAIAVATRIVAALAEPVTIGGAIVRVRASIGIEAVIRLGQVMHLDIVAEGVETADQAAELTLLGCRAGQGYHLARPMPAPAIDAYIAGVDAITPPVSS